MTAYHSVDEIERLVARFADCSLPCAEWTHEAHLTVGLWHAWRFPADEALDRVRAGILQYNVACNVPTTPTRGYHETITRLYMLLIDRFLVAAADRNNLFALTNELLATHGDRALPLTYYTRERLFSPEARADWLPPDLRPLA